MPWFVWAIASTLWAVEIQTILLMLKWLNLSWPRKHGTKQQTNSTLSTSQRPYHHTGRSTCAIFGHKEVEGSNLSRTPPSISAPTGFARIQGGLSKKRDMYEHKKLKTD